MNRYRYIFLSILTPVLILSAVIGFYAFNESWYASIVNSLPSPERASPTEARAVFDYIKSGDPSGLISHTERERAHLSDIRDIFKGIRFTVIILAVLWAVTAVSLQRKEGVLAALPYISAGCKWFLLILVAAGGSVAIYFDQIFLQFHYLVFQNTFWQLNPETETLIWTFPPEYFYFTALRVSVITFIIYFMVMNASTVSLLLLKNKKTNEKI